MSKKVDTRVDECTRLRRQWKEKITDPFPPELVGHMNAFVLDGTEAAGKNAWKGSKTLHYQFTQNPAKKTYIRVGATWL